jgi:hypothetical protein
MGAHVKNQNTGKIGVCLFGCFHPSEPNCSDLPRRKALVGATSLIAFLCKSYGVSVENILAHRDFLSTACPGDELYSRMQTIRRRVAEKLKIGQEFRPSSARRLSSMTGLGLRQRHS